MKLNFEWEVHIGGHEAKDNEAVVDLKGLQLQINGENAGPLLPPEAASGSVIVPDDMSEGVFSIVAVDVFDQPGEKIDFPFTVGRPRAPHNLRLRSAGTDS